MTRHMTGTREEWLAARLELLEAEKALTRRNETGPWWRRHDEYDKD
ncbi:hypothetical protein ACN1C3_09435 [Pseudomonas sp. H11T01]